MPAEDNMQTAAKFVAEDSMKRLNQQDIFHLM